MGRVAALWNMPKFAEPSRSNDALNELVDQLLACGAVLSQMISHMVRWEAAGRSAPDTAPIPTIAHSLIADVSKPVSHRHSRRDLRIAAAIVEEITEAICDQIYSVPLDEPALDDLDPYDDAIDGPE
jgi:hypothetical protein